MYFAQGIPQGLLAIAIPAWLVTQGVGPAQIGSYLAVIVLPWAFKLVTGPLMDRLEYLPMGRRRPWVLAAQLGLALSLLSLSVVENAAEQIGLLMLLGVLINSFAATQDVAVDGMAIDLTPVREQGRLNAFMSFGKSIGWAATAAASGVMLVSFGLAVTAVAAAAASALMLLYMLFVLERDGEKILPFSPGRAASTHLPGSSFADVFKGINQVLWVRTSVLIMVIMFFDGLVFGYGHALMPIAAVKLFNFSSAQWSQLVAMMGLAGAVAALAVGPLIDRLGAKWTLTATIMLVGLHALLLAQTQHLWQDTLYVRVMLSAWIMMLPIVMVSVLALAMSICNSTLSATQFAVYMSVANLGNAAGSKLYGVLSEQVSYVESYTFLTVLALGMVLVLLLYRHDREAPGAVSTGGGKATRQYTLGIGGAEAGGFRSGAMRCPKCRADMEAVEYDGTEVDRCNHCRGIWFDAGEAELLKTRTAAAAIDMGAAALAHDAVRDYPCPRCGGEMIEATDSRQRHIQFESCAECHGFFFDAGEFRDIASYTLGEFFSNVLRQGRK
jgi:MFS transporter, PAT family, beta-lactamase induction signal transducer AmpG